MEPSLVGLFEKNSKTIQKCSQGDKGSRWSLCVAEISWVPHTPPPLGPRRSSNSCFTFCLDHLPALLREPNCPVCRESSRQIRQRAPA